MKKPSQRVNPYQLDGKLVLPEKDEIRFFSKSKKVGKCWIWQGKPLRDGYGQFTFNLGGIKHKERAHRMAFYLSKGPVGEDELICHSCDNPLCVNPAHLWKGDCPLNNRDRDRKKRANPRSGTEHWTQLHPEKVASGERSAAKKHPHLYIGNPNGGKLKPDQIREIRRLWKHPRKFTRKEVAAKFNVSTGCIYEVTSGRSWSYIE